jgi:hypothetical protein
LSLMKLLTIFQKEWKLNMKSKNKKSDLRRLRCLLTLSER